MVGAKTTKTETANPAGSPNQASRPHVSALKYYIHDGTEAFRFQLIGELREMDVKELAGCWDTAKTTFGSRKLVLDLQRLASTDESGKEWLLEMLGGFSPGVVINFLLDNCAVDIVRSKPLGYLGHAGRHHNPVSLDMRDVIEHQA